MPANSCKEQRNFIKPSQYLLELLVCPVSKTSLYYDTSRQELSSSASMASYPVIDGVPMMLPLEY